AVVQCPGMTDGNVRRSAIVSGDVDWAISVPAQSVAELKEDDNVVVDEVPAGAYWYVGVNTASEPLSDVRVRQAIAWALNRDEIAERSEEHTSELQSRF